MDYSRRDWIPSPVHGDGEHDLFPLTMLSSLIISIFGLPNRF